MGFRQPALFKRYCHRKNVMNIGSLLLICACNCANVHVLGFNWPRFVVLCAFHWAIWPNPIFVQQFLKKCNLLGAQGQEISFSLIIQIFWIFWLSVEKVQRLRIIWIFSIFEHSNIPQLFKLYMVGWVVNSNISLGCSPNGPFRESQVFFCC